MAHIFLSYDSHDRSIARQIVAQLEANGWSVWWDRRIQTGKPWRAALDKALREMDCMVVLWSAQSIDSDWVIEEAEEGRARGKLLPVLIEAVAAPRGFRQIQALSFVDWDGTAQAGCFRTLLQDLQAITGEAKHRSAGSGAEASRHHAAQPGTPSSSGPAGDAAGTSQAHAGRTDAGSQELTRKPGRVARKLVAGALAGTIAVMLFPLLGLTDVRTVVEGAKPYSPRSDSASRYDERPGVPVRSYEDRARSRADAEPVRPTQTTRVWRERSYDSERGWDGDGRWRIESDRGDGRPLSDEQVRSALSAMETMGLLPDGIRRVPADRSWTASEIEQARRQLEASRTAKRQIDPMGR
jgi:hypothetical protein